MGKVGFTPIIGLAVVVALALAAVFGSMSLANPAMAAIGQPGDAELTERTFSPQDASTSVTQGEALSYNIASLITGGGANFNSATVTCVPACSGGNPIAAAPTVTAGFGAINLVVGATDVAAVGRVRMTLDVDLKQGENQEIVIDVTVTPVVNESPTVKMTIPDQTVVIQADATDDAATSIDFADYFNDGRGNGVITAYTISDAPSGTLTFTPASPVDATAGSVTAMSVPSTVGTPAALVAVTVVATNASDDDPSITFFVNVVAADAAVASSRAGLPSFEASSQDPGDSANYTIEFAMTSTVNTRQNDLVIEFHEDHGIPSSIRQTSVAITTDGGSYTVPGPGGATDPVTVNTRTFTPEEVTVDGEKILLSLGDMDEQDNRTDYVIGAPETVTVHFRQSAGITTPTEQGGYNLVGIEFGGTSFEYDDSTDPVTNPNLEENVYRKISLSEEDGGLGDTVEATGKGYKNGTTLTVFLDKLTPVTWDDPNDNRDSMVPLPADMVAEYDERVMMDADYGNIPMGDIPTDGGMAMHTRTVDNIDYAMAPNRRLDLGEDVLCVAPRIDGSDIGKCEFSVTHPTFAAGTNYVNAVDGRNNYSRNPDTFVLEASIAASPAGGSPGEIILIQVVDFPAGAITKVEIARRALGCGGCGGNVDLTGADNFSITIPNWAKAGIQELRVTGQNGVTANTNITLAGPTIQVTPESVVANRRVSLVGTGFSPGAVIANASDDHPLSVSPKVSIGGETIMGGRINDSEPVTVDNGGNWSASVDLPLVEATTAEGDRAIRVTDSRGRTGVVIVDIPARKVTVTPEAGRVGTIAVVRGEGFPGKNDEGSSFSIEIIYDANNDNTTTVSALTDASGRFETQLRIPTTAAIPSSNTIKVSFFDDDDVKVTTTVAHEVPEGIITLSETSGGPGSNITINGEGFKSFVPISLVRLGNLDITPAPKPSTDGNGMMEFGVTIPGLDVGIQTIEVHVGQTTSSTGFTVTESGINPGDIKPVAEGVGPLGENLDVIWHFNNDTKAWTFYDGQEGSDLTHVIAGETYLLLIKSTAEVILNGNTRSLTCVGGNCWNQIVW